MVLQTTPLPLGYGAVPDFRITKKGGDCLGGIAALNIGGLFLVFTPYLNYDSYPANDEDRANKASKLIEQAESGVLNITLTLSARQITD